MPHTTTNSSRSQLSRAPDQSGAPPLPPQPHRLPVHSVSPSPSSSNDSVTYERSLPIGVNRTQKFAKPPGPQRKKVTSFENISELTFPKKNSAEAAPPVPRKTRRRSSTRNFGEDTTSFDVYVQEDPEDTDLYPTSSKQQTPAIRRVGREKPQFVSPRSRVDDDSFVLRSVRFLVENKNIFLSNFRLDFTETT